MDSSGLLQTKRTSQLVRHSSLETGFDCTGQDMWLWLGGHGDRPTVVNGKLKTEGDDAEWAVKSASDFSGASKVLYARTGGRTCKQYCENMDLVCVRGMDDAHHQTNLMPVSQRTKCTLWAGGHNRQSQEQAGCLQKWYTQMCACDEKTVVEPIDDDKELHCYPNKVLENSVKLPVKLVETPIT